MSSRTQTLYLQGPSGISGHVGQNTRGGDGGGGDHQLGERGLEQLGERGIDHPVTRN
jgi:hypothetical protein